jgi:hypothetical protein
VVDLAERLIAAANGRTDWIGRLLREAAQGIEAAAADETRSGPACESAVGETDASDAALLADIFDNMAEVLKPLPGELTNSSTTQEPGAANNRSGDIQR